jgi:large subunit ribosomal protein L13
MKTFFIKNKTYNPLIYILDASKQVLGKLASKAILYLKGKQNPFYSQTKNLSNFVIIINAENLLFNKKKEKKSFYYKNSQTPGHLKIFSFYQLKKEFPNIIIETAIKRMLKNRLGSKQILDKLFIYKNDIIRYKKSIKKHELNFIHHNIFKIL